MLKDLLHRIDLTDTGAATACRAHWGPLASGADMATFASAGVNNRDDG